MLSFAYCERIKYTHLSYQSNSLTLIEPALWLIIQFRKKMLQNDTILLCKVTIINHVDHYVTRLNGKSELRKTRMDYMIEHREVFLANYLKSK